MSTAQHTPGPWKAVGKSVLFDMPSGGQYICRMSTGSLAEYAEANARLIAAAPELLAALKAMLPLQDWTVGAASRDALSLAQTAIAKAEGRA